MREHPGRSWLASALAAVASVMSLAERCGADTYDVYLSFKADQRSISQSLINHTPAERVSIQRGEDEAINIDWEHYLFQQKLIPAISQPSWKAMFPTATADDGDSGLLTFHFISPATGLPTAGPAVAFVLYEINQNPDTPGYTPLGISTDASTDFSFPYTVAGLEPDIQATPFDASGAPIFLPGFDGSNVAVGSVTIFAPEPSSLVLVMVGGVGAIGHGWRRHWAKAA
jgi:hypothetical protein